MARWALSPMVGTGLPQDSFRPLAAQYATAWTSLSIETSPGVPYDWCIVRATAGDMAAADADPLLTVFPDLAYTDVLTGPQRTWLTNKVTSLGRPTGWITAGLTFGAALLTIARYLEANFEITWLRGD